MVRFPGVKYVTNFSFFLQITYQLLKFSLSPKPVIRPEKVWARICDILKIRLMLTKQRNLVYLEQFF